MGEQYLSEIRAFSFAYAPQGWQMCNGQTLPVNQYQALFSLIGTTYGGNGVTNFMLPDLRGRIAIGQGNGYAMGQKAGEESHTLSTAEIPGHNHTLNPTNNGASNGTNLPGSTVVLGSGSTGGNLASIYDTSALNVALAPLTSIGGGQPHENRMPSSVLNYCIAMVGIYPSRG